MNRREVLKSLLLAPVAAAAAAVGLTPKPEEAKPLKWENHVASHDDNGTHTYWSPNDEFVPHADTYVLEYEGEITRTHDKRRRQGIITPKKEGKDAHVPVPRR